MDEPPDLETRVTALEARVDSVAAETSLAMSDAMAARHLAAARDRDLAELTVRVDANRTVINAVGQQLSARITDLSAHVDQQFARVDQQFARVDRQFAQVDQNFVGVRGQLDAAAAGQQTIVDMLTRLLDERGPGA